ncbi:hypothetical protein [Winogradskyella sp.]|uniref:hypothetical protein n=1 Tax=Winogradskyella sp. TaxID=1883156 RepID=UPI003F6D556F
MKHILYLFLISVLVFISCEGRKTSHEALLESIEAYDKEVVTEKIVFIPEYYSEREVDTLFQNGYSVQIKTYSDMANSILFTKIEDTINYQTYYRNFKFDIRIERDGKLIFEECFDKKKINLLFRYDTITKSNIEDHEFDKIGILKSIEVNDDAPMADKLKIDVIYAIPETDRTSLHSIIIDKKGRLKVERIGPY